MRAEQDGEGSGAARRRLGNLTRTQEEVRRVWIASFFDTLAQDARYTWRSWRRNPGFALGSIGVLALGLGSSIALFGALDRILFRELPYRDPGGLVSFGVVDKAQPSGEVESITDWDYFLNWEPPPEPLEEVTTIFAGPAFCDITERRPERVPCQSVEWNFLRVLGVAPILGRDFVLEDDQRGAPRVALVSYELWQRRFSGATDVNGKHVTIGGEEVPVIGVLPPDFKMPLGASEILLPEQMHPMNVRQPYFLFLSAIGRLKPGVTPEQALMILGPRLHEGARGMAERYPGTYAPGVRSLRDRQMGDAPAVAWLLLAAIGALLLIACANVTNLNLARLASRGHEFEIREAVGAGRGRMVRLAFTEGFLLTLSAGMLGLVLAWGLLTAFVRLAPSHIATLSEASLDWRVAFLAVLLTAGVGILIGIWPAFGIARTHWLQHGSRAIQGLRPRLRFALITLQIAVTVAMLGASSLLVRSLWNQTSIPLGFRAEQVITLAIDLNNSRYVNPRQQADFLERLMDRIHEWKGTDAATLSSAPVPTGIRRTASYMPVDGAPWEFQPGGSMMRIRIAAPGYFETLGIHLQSGRPFLERDRDTTLPAAVLSESAARILFPGQDPLGHTVTLPSEPPRVQVEVVGVASDIQNSGLNQPPQPEIYTVWTRQPDPMLQICYIALRTSAPAADAVAFLRNTVEEFDPALPFEVGLLTDEVTNLTARARFLAWLISAFSWIALVLAATGLYGVVSYLVTQRTRDIGVRMALGAAPGRITRQFAGEVGLWIAAGMVLGGVLAWATSRILEGQLYEVTPGDPVSWGIALVTLVAVLVFATLRPARRAARVDPATALRTE